ncbi:hypothetical protein [Bifidobacterium simiarum]|uniref:hypothetical protein n=1 Tax=Bifidobacterium simiarum TaxID=2045441 RepID=UPI001BDC728F|nr:hypothetical protein [Bifidobacterium simiarum]MBT1167267.1 hypothetical protein [Bifidobacterium simiarum]
MPARVISKPEQLHALAARITDTARRHAIVVISTAWADGRSPYDPDGIAAALSGTDAATYLLSDPDMGPRIGRLTGGMVRAFDGAAAILPAPGRGIPCTVVYGGRDSEDYLIDRTMECSSFVRHGPATEPDPWEENRRLTRENRRLRDRLAETRERKGPSAAGPGPDPDRWPDDMLDDWLRLAVTAAWADDTDPATKRRHRLPDDWHVAKGLGAAVADRADRAAILRCMSRILMGFKVDAHPLRDGTKGNPNATGPWGNLVWRVCVKRNSPDATRLHYTRDERGAVVFIAVGGHDDMI